MEVRFFLTSQDLWNFTKYGVLRTRVPLLLGLLLFISIGLFLFFPLLSTGSITQADVVTTAGLMLAIPVFFGLLRRQTRSRVGRDQALQGEQIITISPEGFRHRSNLTDNMISWRAFKTITTDKYNLYFIIGPARMVAHLIPRHAFATPQEAETFLGLAQRYWATGRQPAR